jgi:hypothetical protein
MVVRFILIAGPGANKYSMSTQALRLVALGCDTIYPCIQFRPSLHLQQICSETSRFGCTSVLEADTLARVCNVIRAILWS